MFKDGIMVDPEKIEVIRDLARLTSVTEIWSFIGLACYYRLFVERRFLTAAPSTQLTCLDVPFEWSN